MDATKRRGFVKEFACIVLGAITTAVPFLAGLAVFFDPLRRKGEETGAVLVTTLDSLPMGGPPRKFPVVADKVDAWNKFTQVPVGAVYLRRDEKGKVHAFNVICPHAGCFVDYIEDKGDFLCPCHNSAFAVDGSIEDPRSPSPRGLDALVVEVKNKEVWVQFQNFQAGHADKVPVA